MYPLTHIYFAEKLLGFLDDAAILGSIFPDVAILSGIEWSESHTLGLCLWENFRGKREELVHFSLGVITHGIKPKGLDYYSDEKYRDFEKGYCFEKARPLVDAVVEACNISPDDGWWKSHNFVEMGIELYLYEKQPELLVSLKKALANNNLITILINDLSPVLKKDKDLLEKVFSTFRKFIEEEPLDAQILALRYQKQIYFRHNIEFIDLAKSQSIINRSKELIGVDIEDFFNEVKEQVSPIIKEMLMADR
ncbi:MAG: hypothetical protein Q7J85_05130 [Bacillota bacterium]|nr:hypothetical protein [Bacillota bacterium]